MMKRKAKRRPFVEEKMLFWEMRESFTRLCLKLN